MQNKTAIGALLARLALEYDLPVFFAWSDKKTL